jgi:hypothetical protein
MAIWHPSLTFYQDEYCTGLWWGGLLKNPTGLYPSLTTPGQLDAGNYFRRAGRLRFISAATVAANQ